MIRFKPTESGGDSDRLAKPDHQSNRTISSYLHHPIITCYWYPSILADDLNNRVVWMKVVREFGYLETISFAFSIVGLSCSVTSTVSNEMMISSNESLAKQTFFFVADIHLPFLISSIRHCFLEVRRQWFGVGWLVSILKESTLNPLQSHLMNMLLVIYIKRLIDRHSGSIMCLTLAISVAELVSAFVSPFCKPANHELQTLARWYWCQRLAYIRWDVHRLSISRTEAISSAGRVFSGLAQHHRSSGCSGKYGVCSEPDDLGSIHYLWCGTLPSVGRSCLRLGVMMALWWSVDSTSRNGS